MNNLSRAGVGALLLLAAFASPARGQTAAELVDRGVAAYQRLDLGAASALLRQALELRGDGRTSDSLRIRALSYLGATEFFQDRPDSADAAFSRLLRIAPRHQLDRLIFPPNVGAALDRVRRGIHVVAPRAPADTSVRLGDEAFSVRLHASAFHEIHVEIRRTDGTPVRTVYDGPIGDSLDVRWNGRDAAGQLVAPADLLLVVDSRDPAGSVLRSVQLPLSTSVLEPDTLPHPAPPADSLFMPEATPAGPPLRSLLGGVALGGLAAALPALVGGDTPAGTRFLVAASVSVAGIAGFITNRPGRPVPAHISANREIRSEYQGRLDDILRRNRDRLSDRRLRVRTGAPAHIERGGP